VTEGQRVAAGKEGFRATVRYVGPVEGQEGQWAGLEWDDATRGKHDGTVGGKSYFRCAPGGGSLVRVEKLARGVPFAAALRGRYAGGEGSAEGEGEAEAEMVVMTASQRTVAVELVGADKLAVDTALSRLRVASLRGGVVSSAGEPAALAALAPELEELDLSGNLLSSWAEVEAISRALPKLTALNLTANRLQPAPGLAASLPLSVLVLNQSGVRWAEVAQLGACLPSLAQLYLNGNGISELQLPGGSIQAAFPALTLLSLEENQLAGWAEVAALAALPKLERLHLSGNLLPEVAPPEQGQWPALLQVTLGQNRIASWRSIDALAAFPRLSELRLTGNPVMDSARSGGRFEVIGRMAQLRLLNGSVVQPRERQDAELRYLRIVWGELEEGGAAGRARAEAAHPRLPELLQKYGPMSSSTAAAGSMESLATQMKEVKLTCTSLKAGGVMGTKVKKLPGSMTVAQLKKLCETLFKLKASEQAVWLKISGEPMPENIGLDEGRPLSYFDMKDGYEIIIDDPHGA